MLDFEALRDIDSSIVFDFEEYIRLELNIKMDRPSDSPEQTNTGGQEGICRFFQKGFCAKGQNCPYRHISGSSAPKNERTIVCKHWLRGLCKKGDLCEFLHEYNLKKMPECWFFAKYGECSNPECIYLHIDPESKIKECAWYSRGFCKHGADCKHKHVRKAPCLLYITGFCPKGPDCTFGHPKFELPSLGGFEHNQPAQPSHPSGHQAIQTFSADSRGHRPLEEVTCFKCGAKGHFANQCNQRRNPDVGRQQQYKAIPSLS